MSDSYIIVHEWMVEELGLKGNELLLYALIYGFEEFSGSISYIEKWLNVSRPTAIDLLKSLTQKELIEKSEKYLETNLKSCTYKAKKRRLRNLTGGGKEICKRRLRNLTGGGKETLPNNINNNINNNTINNKANKFHNFEQRNYNFEVLEGLLKEN